MSSGIPIDGERLGTYRQFDPGNADELADLMRQAVLEPTEHAAPLSVTFTPVPSPKATGWGPVLSALVDSAAGSLGA